MTTFKNTYNETLQCDNMLYLPISVRVNKLPLDPTNYTFVEESPITSNGSEKTKNEATATIIDRTKFLFKLNKPQTDLVAFGIWGRLFLNDFDHSNNESKSM